MTLTLHVPYMINLPYIQKIVSYHYRGRDSKYGELSKQ